MGHVSHDRFATRFSFSEDDLVLIDGRPMRLRHRNSEGCSFEPEGGGLTEHFTHPEITALQRRNRISIKGRHFVAQGVRHVLERGDRLHSLVDGTLEERIRFREAVVLGFREVQRKQMDTTGRIALKRTDASITAHSGLISMEEGYLSIRVDPEEIKEHFVLDPETVPLGSSAVAKKLGTIQQVVNKLAAAGLISSVAPNGRSEALKTVRVLPSSLRQFQETYVFLMQLRQELGLHHRMINNALRRLGVEPVADPAVLKVTLFRRADITLEFYDGKF